MIRAAAVLQLLLGNIGRPGGGILALRGHATIQGSTDIATLYNLLPGYLYAPSALRNHATLADYINQETSATSYWSNLPKFVVSQLKAWFGAAATAVPCCESAAGGDVDVSAGGGSTLVQTSFPLR